MKLSLLDRTITCCLLGAATLAAATGMSRVAPPADDNDHAVVASENDEGSASFFEIRELDDNANEKSLRDLVEAVTRASQEEKGDKRNQLKEALSQIFQKRIAAQRERIAAIRERLEAIESQMDKRSNLEDQIVERRLGELLGEKDELSWDHEPSLGLEGIGENGRDREYLELAYDFAFDLGKNEPRDVSKLYRTKRATEVKDSVDQARRHAELAQRNAQHAQKNADQEKVNAERTRHQVERIGRQYAEAAEKYRELEFRKLERLQPLESSRKELTERLSNRESEEQSYATRDDATALRAQIEAMRQQSRMLEKQLEEMSKKNSNKAEKP